MSGLNMPSRVTIMRMRLMAQTLLHGQYLFLTRVTGVRDRGEGRGGEGGGAYKPPAMRMRATPIFWKNGTFMGRSIQMGSNKMAKSVSMLSVLAV